MSAHQVIFEVKRQDGKIHIEAGANLVASTVQGQRDVLLQVLNGPEEKVVLNLGFTDQIDSLGITLILGLFKSCRDHAKSFGVEGVSSPMMRVFRLFNLPCLFPVSGR